jgi:hypothetical protein
VQVVVVVDTRQTSINLLVLEVQVVAVQVELQVMLMEIRERLILVVVAVELVVMAVVQVVMAVQVSLFFVWRLLTTQAQQQVHPQSQQVAQIQY